MTQEDKELLLKDLCARLPYNLKCEYNGEIYEVLGVAHGRVSVVKPFMSNSEWPLIEEVKPYLFPLSSMTEEQLPHYMATLKYDKEIEGMVETSDTFDWFNKEHFDYRGLIEKSLALDATGLNIY